MPQFLCVGCRHVSELVTTGDLGGTCAAFPDGIPVEILEGADHRAPRGDEVDGITFEVLDGFEPIVETFDRERPPGK